MPDLLAQAIQYVEKYRFSVIPVHAGDKRPAVVEWETFQHRRPTLEELGAWFNGRTHHNIGIVCGAISGIVVIDVDGEKGEESILSRPMPSHLVMVKTPHGRHLYFRHPGVPVPPRVGVLPGVDIRGDGSYVVAPPSKIDGAEYAWGIGLDFPAGLPALPGWAFADRPKPKPKEPGWIREFLDGVEEGRRDDACTRLAGFYLKRGLREEEVIDTLVPWGKRCRPAFPEDDVRKCVSSVAGREKTRRSPLELEVHDWTDIHARVLSRPRRSWLFRGIWPEDAYGVFGAD